MQFSFVAVSLAVLFGVFFARVYGRWIGVSGARCNQRTAAWRYVIGETLLLYGLYYVTHPVSMVLWVLEASIVSLLLIALLVDLDTMYIPDEVSGPLIALSLSTVLINEGFPVVGNQILALILPGLVGYFAFVGINKLHLKLTDTHGLGGGDAKLFAAIAVLVGGIPALLILASASFMSVVHHLIARARGVRCEIQPFGPPLIASTYIVWFAILRFGALEFHDALSLPFLPGAPWN